jgi:membrane protein implicated in regulation of membrane protease activity
MGILYLAALVIGGGTLALQLLMGGHDADAGGGDHGGDVHDASADAHDGHDAHGHGEGGFLPIVLSLRFWTYGLLGFGMVGAALHYLQLSSSYATPLIAAAVGLVAGLVASWTFRALSRTDTSSGLEANDAVGQVGRVLVPCGRGGKGKIRIELRGQSIDLLATTDDEELASGSQVMVEEMRGQTAHVSRAPADFLPNNKR